MTRLQARELQEKLFPIVHFQAPDASGKMEGYQHRHTLPEICLHVRMSISGGFDPYETNRLMEIRHMLVATEKTWTDNKDLIDALIHTMVWHTIRIIDKELLRRRTGA